MATFLTSDPFRMKPTHLSVNPQAFADKKKKFIVTWKQSRMEYSGGYFLVLIDSEEVCSMLLLLPGFGEKQYILSFYAGFKMCAAFRQLASSL